VAGQSLTEDFDSQIGTIVRPKNNVKKCWFKSFPAITVGILYKIIFYQKRPE
jgi:hypothetical protein